MNIQNSINKIEVIIWDRIILLMTESSLIQATIKNIFFLVKDKEIIWIAGLFLGWICAGITVGYYLGFSGIR